MAGDTGAASPGVAGVGAAAASVLAASVGCNTAPFPTAGPGVAGGGNAATGEAAGDGDKPADSAACAICASIAKSMPFCGLQDRRLDFLLFIAEKDFGEHVRPE